MPTRLVRTHPGVAANRLTEIRRKLAEDDLTPHHRASYEQAAESLEGALRGQVRCVRCGRRLEATVSRELGIGPECLRKAAS